MTDPDDLKPEGDPVRPRFGAQPDDQKSEGKEKRRSIRPPSCMACRACAAASASVRALWGVMFGF